MQFYGSNRLIWFVGPLLAFALLLTAACGGGSAPEDVSFTAAFADGKLTPDTLQVRQGDNITLSIESDRPGVFHLHGYDLEREAAPGANADFQFAADATGRFLINFHGPANQPEADPADVLEKSMQDLAGLAHSASDSRNVGGMAYTGSVNPSSDGPDALGLNESMGHASGGGMDHGSMEHGLAEVARPAAVSINARADDHGGVHVGLATEGWRWAPEEVNLENSPNAGHAHIYVDGVKMSRVYGPYHYLPDLEPGQRNVRVNLNDNQHSVMTWQGEPLEASVTVTVPPASADRRPPEPVVAEAPMSVGIVPHADALGGYNLQVSAPGFTFAQEPGLPHVPGQGYALLSINGEPFNRMYVPWLQAPAQGAGTHTFSVALLNNEGRPYHYNGRPVSATVSVDEGDKGEPSGPGHHADGAAGGDHHHGGDGAAAVELELGYLEVLPR